MVGQESAAYVPSPGTCQQVLSQHSDTEACCDEDPRIEEGLASRVVNPHYLSFQKLTNLPLQNLKIKTSTTSLNFLEALSKPRSSWASQRTRCPWPTSTVVSSRHNTGGLNFWSLHHHLPCKTIFTGPPAPLPSKSTGNNLVTYRIQNEFGFNEYE